MANESTEVIGVKVDQVVAAVGKLEIGLAEVNRTLQTLVRVESKQVEQASSLNRAFIEIEDHEKRLKVMEVKQPALLETRNWVISGMVFLAGSMIWGVLTGHILMIAPK